MKLIPIGGMAENGKNCYIIESNDTIIILDVGNKKFDNPSLGIDSILSESKYLNDNKNKIKGIFISHSHQDQMGGLEFLLNDLKLNIPVYGSNYTIEFLKKTIKYNNFKIINYDEQIKINNLIVEAFNLSHSVFGNYGFLISDVTSKEAIVYSTDYNFNQQRKENVRTDIDKIINLKGKYKIKALLTESISSTISGSAAGSTNFMDSVKKFAELTKGKLFISLYSTNVSGMINVINVANELNKKIVIIGRDLLTYVNISKSLGYIEHQNDMFIKVSDIKKYRDDEIIVVVAGVYLEPFRTLKDLTNKNHPLTTIEEKDSVLIASQPYDETEGEVQALLDYVSRTNCQMKTQQITVASHAQREDIKMMINLFEPEHIIPIKGEYRKLKEVEYIAQKIGYNPSNIHLLENGDILTISDKVYKSGTIPVGNHLLNDKNFEQVAPILLQDRADIANEGYVLVVLIYDKKTKKIIQKPQIISGGLMSFDDDQELLELCENIIEKEIQSNDSKEVVVKIRNKLKRFLNNKIGKAPLVLTVRMEVNK